VDYLIVYVDNPCLRPVEIDYVTLSGDILVSLMAIGSIVTSRVMIYSATVPWVLLLRAILCNNISNKRPCASCLIVITRMLSITSTYKTISV